MKGKITLIQILLIFVLVICGTNMYKDRAENKKEEDEFEDIAQSVEVVVTRAPTSTAIPDEKEERLKKYSELYKKNKETIGWIRIKGTKIDYPVMHNVQSNAYYLHRNFNREYSSSGIPFLDYQCKGDATSDNSIIYAHNMRNGTMFHDLLNYKDASFYASHAMIEFDTLTELGRYEIFAVLRTKVGGENEFKYYDFIDAHNPADFDSFIAECLNRSLYKTQIIPRYGDKILTLSTCSYNTDNERFVVFARKITV